MQAAGEAEASGPNYVSWEDLGEIGTLGRNWGLSKLLPRNDLASTIVGS